MPVTLDDILTSHRTRRAIVMGIVNVTPDSFSDGGRFLDPRAAADQARRLADEGADVLDLGAESTRPGSLPVPPAEQIARLRDVLPAAVATGLVVSVDTTRAEVARFALDAGAAILNDISAGRADPALLDLAARRGAAVVLMHMLGTPADMQTDPHYDDVVAEVRAFLAERLDATRQAGIARGRLIVDPGIGFGKRTEHNLALLRGLADLTTLDVPVLVGASRKRFIGELAHEPDPARRGPGTIAACLAARRRGAAIFRVHDVPPLRQALAIADQLDPPETAEVATECEEKE